LREEVREDEEDEETEGRRVSARLDALLTIRTDGD